MDNNPILLNQKDQEDFRHKLFTLFHKTYAVEWQNGTYYFSHDTTMLQKIFSRRFDFDDETLSKYFDYIDWNTFIKYNKSLNISIEVRRFVFSLIYKKTAFYYSKLPLFHPLCNFNLFEKFFKTPSNFKNANKINERNSFRFINSLNNYCHKEKLPNESLIKVNKFVALHYSSRVQFPWSKEFIENYIDYFDWELLSCNSGLHLNDELIELFKEKWNWSTLIYNSSLSLSIDFLKKYKSYINWKSLSSKEGEFWTEEILDTFLHEWNWAALSNNKSILWELAVLSKYESFIDWKIISGNPSLELSIDTLDLYKDMLFWDGVDEEELDDERGHNETIVIGYGLSSNSSFPWTKFHMTRYKNFLDWEFIDYGNTHICWDLELIDAFSDKLSWSFLFKDSATTNSHLDASDYMQNLGLFLNATRRVSSLKLSTDLLIKYLHVLDKDVVFRNHLIDWDISIFYCIFNYYFNLFHSEKISDVKFRLMLFNQIRNTSIRDFLEEQKKHVSDIIDIDTKNISVAITIDAIASNHKLFGKIFGNYLSEDSVYWATQEY